MTIEDAAFLRTLYIQEQGTVLRIENERFRVTEGEDEKEHDIVNIPSIKVGQIVIFGACMVTPAAMRFCLMHRIPIVLLSSRGKYFSRIESTDDVNIELERLQFDRSTDARFQVQCARNFVQGKIHNASVLLKRRSEERNSLRLLDAIRELQHLEGAVERADAPDAARGFEGRAAAVYFGVLGELLDRDGFSFSKRTRRPPTDPVNSMLSFGYSLLFNNIFSMVRIHRLHPYVGFLHADKPTHPALVSDLIEEFRTVIDGMVLGLVNRHMIGPDEFSIFRRSNGQVRGCYLSDHARKVFLRATYTSTGYHISYRRRLDLQVQEFALFLRGEKEYIPSRRR